ncbi:MAG: PAS domain S-box protein [Nitrospira sp. LK70]|nr:PAS domain S-box protein [Nitrospira sp. LK70]
MTSKTIKKASLTKRKSPRRARTTGTTSRSDLVPPAEENFFARAFRASPHPIGVTELDSGCCLEINDACLEIFGFQRHEVIGKTTLMLGIWPDPLERARFIDRLKAEGSVRNLEVSMRMKNGNLRQFIISTDLIALNGKQCLLTMGNDITERKQTEEALRRSEERWELTATGTTDGIWDWDVAGHTVFLSPRWKQLRSYHEEEIGVDETEWSSRIHPEDFSRVMTTVQSYFKKEIPAFHCEYRTRRKDGTYFWISDRGIAVWDAQGRVVRMVGSETDITERKRAEGALRRAHEELEHRVAERTAELGRSNKRLKAEIAEREQVEALLREQEQEFRFLADNVPAYFSYIDTELRYRFVNKRYEELFGRPLVELTGQYVKDVVGEANFRTIEPHLRKALAGRETSFLYPKVLSNVDTRWMNVHYTPDRDEAGRIRGVLTLATDVTSQKRSELALQQNQLVLQEKRQELQMLTEQLLTAQDRERQRIARDLHDDFSQRLVALSLDLAALDRQSPLSPESLGKALEPVREELAQLSDDLRRLAHRLHPSLLKHAGLRAALEEHIQQATKRTELHITLKVGNVPESLPLDSATCLFRVCQESLQNVVKHANATDVLVKLSGSAKGIGLSVTDNGKGFDVHNKRNHQKGLGLISMQERLRLVKGFLNIHSRPADGTKVCAWIPFQENTP